MISRIPALAMPEKEWVSLPDFGPMAPMDRHLTADFDGSDPAQANALALHALMDGASSILFWVHRDQDLLALCADIDASIAPLHLVGNLDCEHAAQVLGESAQGLFNADPIEDRARSGNWFTGEWSSELVRIRRAEACLPMAMAAVVTNACCASDQGAVGQLAWGLASLEAMQPSSGRPVGMLLNATKDYFETIAMTQAARLLWTANPLWIVGRAAGPKSSNDAADLIDLGLAAQALALGGCRDLWINPLNDSSQAAGWARHQGLVLYYETGLFEQDFPMRGSYLIEEWTMTLADSARAQVAEWNRRGGLVHLLDQNLDPWI